MKRLTIPLLGLFLAISLIACKKSESVNESSNAKSILQESKTNAIKIGEPILFSVLPAPSSSINWTITPSTNTQINNSGNTAIIKFGANGKYLVTARFANCSLSDTISVSDSSNSGSGGRDTLVEFFNTVGEVIKITASKRINSFGTDSVLNFFASTTNGYPAYSTLISTFTSTSNSFAINYIGVTIPLASTSILGYTHPNSTYSLTPMANGTNNLVINFKGNTYTGTVVKSGNSYTINWNYTTGVIISPTTL